MADMTQMFDRGDGSFSNTRFEFNPALGFRQMRWKNGTWDGNTEIKDADELAKMSDQEFAAYKSYQDKKNSRAGISTSTSSSTDANNSNPAFSWNNEDMQKGMWQQAKDMSQLQLDSTLKTMGAASGYRSSELNLNDEITRRQSQQQFGFQKQLSDDNYAFQDKQRAEKERANDEELERTYQMKTETTNQARQAASGAFFGGGNRYNARR